MSIDNDNFINKIIEQLEGYSGVPVITMNTAFRNIDVWDSLTGAAVQIMISDDYGSNIPDDEFRNAITIADLLKLTLKYRK